MLQFRNVPRIRSKASASRDGQTSLALLARCLIYLVNKIDID